MSRNWDDAERPLFPLTVPRSLWDAVAEAVNPEYADSYLWDARLLAGQRLMPRTVMAFERLRDNWAVKQLFKTMEIELEKPTKPPEQHVRKMLPEFFSSDGGGRRGSRPGFEAW